MATYSTPNPLPNHRALLFPAKASLSCNTCGFAHSFHCPATKAQDTDIHCTRLRGHYAFSLPVKARSPVYTFDLHFFGFGRFPFLKHASDRRLLDAKSFLSIVLITKPFPVLNLFYMGAEVSSKSFFVGCRRAKGLLRRRSGVQKSLGLPF